MRDVRAWGARAQAALLFVGLTSGALALSGCGGSPPVAEVNGEQLSEKEFKHLCETTAPEQLQPQQGAVGLQVLGAWIGNAVIAQEARKLKVYPTDEEVNRRIEELKKQSAYGGQDLEQGLKRQGITLADYKRSMISNLVQENVMLRGVTVSEEELRAEFEKQRKRFSLEDTIHMSQITIPTEAKAKQAASELGANGDFTLIARSYSQDVFKQNGGKIPDAVPRKVPPTAPISQAAVDAAFKLKPGQVSDPIKVGGTWVIVKLDEVIPKKDPKLDDVHDSMLSMLRRNKAGGPARNIVMENQRQFMQATSNAKIQVNRPEYQQLMDKSGAAQGMPPEAGAPPTGAPPTGAPPTGAPSTGG